MPGDLYLPPMLLLGPIVAAVIVYAGLRWVIWAPNTGRSPASVSEHALWVGVIGWLASSLQGAMNLGIIPANPSAGGAMTTAETIVPALAWSVLGCLGVHALGQVSYPGPRRMRRQTVLSVRRIHDFLPRRLAAVTAAIFAAAGALIVWTATLPGFAPVAPGVVLDGPYSQRPLGGDGRIPGSELAAWLGGALAVLAVGTLLVLRLIASRRQLEALDADENAVLRTIAMNRLLRTVSTVASGLGVIAGNFAARPDQRGLVVDEPGRPGGHRRPPGDVAVAAAADRSRRTGRTEPAGHRPPAGRPAPRCPPHLLAGAPAGPRCGGAAAGGGVHRPRPDGRRCGLRDGRLRGPDGGRGPDGPCHRRTAPAPQLR